MTIWSTVAHEVVLLLGWNEGVGGGGLGCHRSHTSMSLSKQNFRYQLLECMEDAKVRFTLEDAFLFSVI